MKNEIENYILARNEFINSSINKIEGKFKNQLYINPSEKDAVDHFTNYLRNELIFNEQYLNIIKDE